MAPQGNRCDHDALDCGKDIPMLTKTEIEELKEVANTYIADRDSFCVWGDGCENCEGCTDYDKFWKFIGKLVKGK